MKTEIHIGSLIEQIAPSPHTCLVCGQVDRLRAIMVFREPGHFRHRMVCEGCLEGIKDPYFDARQEIHICDAEQRAAMEHWYALMNNPRVWISLEISVGGSACPERYYKLAQMRIEIRQTWEHWPLPGEQESGKWAPMQVHAQACIIFPTPFHLPPVLRPPGGYPR